MNSKTRKRIWPVSLVMALAVIGMMAVIALSSNPGMAQAQGLCETASGATLQALIDSGVCPGGGGDDDEALCDTATGATLQALIDSGVCMAVMDDVASGGDMIRSDSTSGGAAPEFQVVIASLSRNLAVGSSIVLYLEDDYQEPATIPASSVYFVAENPTNAPTGNGARVYTAIAPKIDTGAYFDEDKKDISIRVFIPDMCTNATDACEGPNGPCKVKS